MKFFLTIFGLSCLFVNAVAQKSDLPFMDEKLSFEQRAADLVSRLTIEEKVEQMKEMAPAISRLGIPAYNWWNETLHGVARSKDTVTVFPQAIGLAATFNREAIIKMGEICADEARAIYNHSVLNNMPGERYKGLTFWTPNINIFRDPRWGRGQETYGEDPYLTGQMGMSIVKGLQGDHPKYLKTSACAKHYAVHSGPESSRHIFDVDVSNKDLWETYLPAFKDLVVKAKVSSVMCAYNRFRGAPACASQFLMVDVLREKWGFTGYVTSDCGAITDFWKTHKTHASEESAAAAAVNMGTDLECGEFWDNHWTYAALTESVKQGLLDENKLDESLVRLFLIRMRLGMFDKKVPFNNIDIASLGNKEHLTHSFLMAKQSMVLLKNNGVLPLSKKMKHIAVMGPNAANKEVLLGNYFGIPKSLITVLEGMKNKLGSDVTVTYEQGTDYIKWLPGNMPEAIVEKVSSADIVVFVGGINPLLEGEDGDAGKEEAEGFYKGDRTTIALPKVQTQLMQMLKKQGKKVIFVNMSGSAVGMEWEAANVDAIIQAWYGGQFAGAAVADIIFGDYNPSGRLPVSFYKNDTDLPDFENYSMENRTYRFFKGTPQFAFGHGLSYTSFTYAKPILKNTAFYTNETIDVPLSITNNGKLDGDEVVQVYVKPANGKDIALKQFQRIHVKAGKIQKVSLPLEIANWASYDDVTMGMVVKPGDYIIMVGSASNKIYHELRVKVLEK
jgi:beta-glucosidase